MKLNVVYFSEQTAKRLVKRLGDSTEQDFQEWNRRSDEDTVVIYAFPPPSGIPAAVYDSTTKTLTTGTAMCKLAIQGAAAGVYKEGTESVLVENQIGTAVALSGRPITIAMNSFGRWEIIVEDCTAGSTGGNPYPDDPVPRPSPDPINEGTSKSFSLGYTLGI